jgi:hypothetical protein
MMHKLTILLFLLLITFSLAQLDSRDKLSYSPQSRISGIWWETPGNEIIEGPTYDQLSGWLDVLPTLGCQDIEIIQWTSSEYQAIGVVAMEKAILQSLNSAGYGIDLMRREGDSTFRDSSYMVYGQGFNIYTNFVGGKEGATLYWCKYVE